MGTVLSSAVVAALLVSLLNHASLWIREEEKRRREVVGMLQRARSAATMLLQALDVVSYDPNLSIGKRVHALTEMMLSPEFTTATAGLNLEQAYRALERLDANVRPLAENSAQLRAYANDSRTIQIVDPESGEENPDYDPELDSRRHSYERAQSSITDKMKDDLLELRESVSDLQKTVPMRPRWWQAFQ